MNQGNSLHTIFEEVSNTFSDSTSQMSSYLNHAKTGMIVCYKHILSFYKTNRHGAQVYLDPNEEYAIRIDDHDIEFEEKIGANKQGEMYMDKNGT
ncbi:hypothetical protein DD595_25210 [Enterobacter cloacae complex sp. 4DZ3-17B2]|uniref:hypothetical protein n=1 Tax=Enterobacter cloacae complex sp. 4DZ3-17B2 TaxID=2511990 RepID=UPI0010123CF9|nr:hypothetical protein [Enterobacter cloacae complex sp. 4DZ3-17B2]RYA72769.1 hypothetical protein DD595_25210 [Enterobacter cloacae complex sp. 4DZ3-17B2]